MMRFTLLTAATVSCFLALAGSASAQTGDRLTDKEVKALLDAVDKGRDRFEDQPMIGTIKVLDADRVRDLVPRALIEQ